MHTVISRYLRASSQSFLILSQIHSLDKNALMNNMILYIQLNGRHVGALQTLSDRLFHRVGAILVGQDQLYTQPS